ncbi:MAG: ABC transporter ATP-binding protein [Alphaproteobacteria bacterium]|nr:ABC transporter ATP-binding protein [Alphaproteobacteria bacterium]
MTAALEVVNLSKSFRGLRAVVDVEFTAAAGVVTAVIGPNGAGKTTLFNLIAGAIKPDAGSVRFGGTDITGLRPDQICRAGIGRTFQLVRPFAGLTVEENVTAGALMREPDVAAARVHANEILALLDLSDRRRRLAAELTLPDRKRLELARALATQPTLLLLDEVMAGLRPTETDRMVETLTRLNRERGLTIVLIEHVMRAVMALAGKVIVLHHGEKIAEGSPAAVATDPAVVESYLGAEVA